MSVVSPVRGDDLQVFLPPHLLGTSGRDANRTVSRRDERVTIMRTDIILPDLGAAPVVLSLWFADPGEMVFEGDRLVEVLAGGATFDVPSPATGRLIEMRVLPDDALRPGQVLGAVEEAATN
jgi:hypothetical protein